MDARGQGTIPSPVTVVAEEVSRRILPLPIYPEFMDEQVNCVIGTVRAFPF